MTYKKKIKHIKHFIWYRRVFQMSHKDIATLTGIKVHEIGAIVNHLENKGFIFIERNNNGLANRYHYIY